MRLRELSIDESKICRIERKYYAISVMFISISLNLRYSCGIISYSINDGFVMPSVIKVLR